MTPGAIPVAKQVLADAHGTVPETVREIGDGFEIIAPIYEQLAPFGARRAAALCRA